MNRMPDVEILRLETLDPELLRRIGSGYISKSKYQVSVESGDSIVFTIKPVLLKTPHRRNWVYPDAQVHEYGRIVSEGFSLAAYIHSEVIALAICSPRTRTVMRSRSDSVIWSAPTGASKSMNPGWRSSAWATTTPR